MIILHFDAPQFNEGQHLASKIILLSTIPPNLTLQNTVHVRVVFKLKMV